MPLKVLFAASKVSPFAAPGSLSDFSGYLPAALAELGVDICVLTPAYPGALEQLRGARRVARFDVRGQSFTMWEGRVADSAATHWLLDFAPLYGREGKPYTDAQGEPWSDNAWRFGCFCEAIMHIALGRAGLRWLPDVLHLNDWQTGLAAAWLSREWPRPRTLFTIHHMDEQGIFGRDAFHDLWLLPEWWSPEALEFHHGWSFMKAGLVFSDAITTVSPTYAREIQTPEYGHGLDGLLRQRADRLHGLLCGIDERRWNPAHDRHLSQTYHAATATGGKRANKHALQAALGLEARDEIPLIAVGGRLGRDFGTDILLQARDSLMQFDAQFAVVGDGDPEIERLLAAWARESPGRVAVRTGKDERLLHLLIAGADMRLLPARTAPRGLYAMQAMNYGTLPVAYRTGGLADAIVDATAETLDANLATGITYTTADANGLTGALHRAMDLYADVRLWDAVQRRGMTQDFSWRRAARAYLELLLLISNTARQPSAA